MSLTYDGTTRERSTAPVKVCVIAKDQALRQSYESIINAAPDLMVISSFDTCEAALRSLNSKNPDLILLTVDPASTNDIVRIRLLRPGLHIIAISEDTNRETIFKALQAGACGYLLKNDDLHGLQAAIKEAVSGGAPLSNHVARIIVESFRRTMHSPLTTREGQVLEQIAKGKSYTVIAKELHIHKETVKSHIRKIYQKLEVNNKAAAIDRAIKERLISLF